ncbi:hypothetical protein CE91St36_14380 [Christensenellaceae bacterium]|nr:hypothetical protein CE91St36_14380 [Christensenellaceae bacterium]BDF61289.1 hypothetical protein CE91St37_14390 [Christensenellaceae bacterium]
MKGIGGHLCYFPIKKHTFYVIDMQEYTKYYDKILAMYFMASKFIMGLLE